MWWYLGFQPISDPKMIKIKIDNLIAKETKLIEFISKTVEILKELIVIINTSVEGKNLQHT